MALIIFDIGNVIIKGDHAIAHKILQGYGVPEDRATRFFENVEEYLDFSRGKITGKQFYHALIKKYLQADLTYEQVVHAHDEHMYGVDAGVIDVLDRLSKSGRHRIMFLTDTNEWQNRREKELIDLNKYSDIILRSNEMGVLKTDDGSFPRILNVIKDKLHEDVSPHEVTLVDDLAKIIEMAKKNGWHTHQFKNSEQLATFSKTQNYLD